MKKQIKFFDIYANFDNWLKRLGFKNISSTSVLDYHYSYYNEFIDDLYSVECYVSDILDFKIRFLRDRNTHSFTLITGYGEISKLISINDFKEIILSEVIKQKQNKQTLLNSINYEKINNNTHNCLYIK